MKKLLFLFMLPMYASENVQKNPKHLRKADTKEAAEITQYQEAFAVTQLNPHLLQLVVDYLHIKTLLIVTPMHPPTSMHNEREELRIALLNNQPIGEFVKPNPDYGIAMSAVLNLKNNNGHQLTYPLIDVQRGEGIPKHAIQ